MDGELAVAGGEHVQPLTLDRVVGQAHNVDDHLVQVALGGAVHDHDGRLRAVAGSLLGGQLGKLLHGRGGGQVELTGDVDGVTQVGQVGNAGPAGSALGVHLGPDRAEIGRASCREGGAVWEVAG